MGLNVSHGCFSAPYSTFNRFRHSLGHQIGIDLKDYVGYGKEEGLSLAEIDHDLMPLFNHSDCCGVLTVDESKKIIEGLKSVLSNFNKTLDFDFNFKYQINDFINGLLSAVIAGEEVEFK